MDLVEVQLDEHLDELLIGVRQTWEISSRIFKADIFAYPLPQLRTPEHSARERDFQEPVLFLLERG